MFDRRQLTVGVASQALSSLTNFLLVVAVARTTSPTQFGGFAIAYSLALVALGIGRGLVGETLSVIAPRGGAISTAGAASPISSAVTIGVVVGGLLAIAGVALHGTDLGPPLMAFGLVLSMVLAQDAVRFVGFAAQVPGLAFRSDLYWLGVQAPLFGILATGGSQGAAGFVLAWGASAGVAVAASCARTGFPARLLDAGWLREHRRLGARLAGEFAVGTGASHLMLYLVAVLAGLPAAGALRAAESMYGPLNSALTGMQSVLLPAASRQIGDTSSRPADVGARIGLGFASLAGVAVLLLSRLPDSVGEALLGESWPGASQLLVPLGVMYLGTAILRGMLVALKAAHAASTALTVRSISGLLLISFGGIGVLTAGARGAAIGMATGQLLGALVAAVATIRTSSATDGANPS